MYMDWCREGNPPGLHVPHAWIRRKHAILAVLAAQRKDDESKAIVLPGEASDEYGNEDGAVVEPQGYNIELEELSALRVHKKSRKRLMPIMWFAAAQKSRAYKRKFRCSITVST